jgi:RecJ-like exonuclease
MADSEKKDTSDSSEEIEYETVTCHACDGLGCSYCNKTGKVEVRKPANLCPKCGGDCCIYCGYTGWEHPRGKYE